MNSWSTPKKYIKKASLMQQSVAGKPKSDRPSTSRVSRAEDAFAGDVTETEGEPVATDKPKPAAKKNDVPKAQPCWRRRPRPRISQPRRSRSSAASKDAARAASLLRVGQNLEKNGGTAAALTYYRRIVKDYPETPAAKTAGERIKVIGGR